MGNVLLCWALGDVKDLYCQINVGRVDSLEGDTPFVPTSIIRLVLCWEDTSSMTFPLEQK